MITSISKNRFPIPWKRGMGILSLALMIFLTSCLNDDDTKLDPVPAAYVSFYHGSPNISSLQIEVDHKPYNTNTFDYSTYFDYERFFTGERNFSFKVGNAANSMLDTLVKFEADKAYSFFISNEAAGFVPIIVEDELETPAAGKASLRIVHLSPDTPEVSLQIGNDKEDVFKDEAYRTVSDFVEVNAGRVNLELLSSKYGESLVKAESINIREGRVYTLVVRGYKDSSSTADKLSLQLVRNYPNY